MKGYDAHHILADAGKHTYNIDAIPQNFEKMISFSFDKFRFLDSLGFLPAGLDKLAGQESVRRRQRQSQIQTVQTALRAPTGNGRVRSGTCGGNTSGREAARPAGQSLRTAVRDHNVPGVSSEAVGAGPHSFCGRQVGCVQCISGWVLRESQTNGTSINGTRTVWTQKSQKAGRYAAFLPPVQSSISLSFTFCYS